MPLPDPYISDPAIVNRNFNDLDTRVTKKVEWGSASVASDTTVTLPGSATLYTVTGTTTITSITASAAGRIVVLVFASTANVTDGSNLKLEGNVTPTTGDTLTLICDGTDWYEISRRAGI